MTISLEERIARASRRVRHKKRGSIYRVIGHAALQTNTPLEDMRAVVIYQCEDDGRFWVRSFTEFEDGRFEELEPAAIAAVREREGATTGIGDDEPCAYPDCACPKENADQGCQRPATDPAEAMRATPGQFPVVTGPPIQVTLGADGHYYFPSGERVVFSGQSPAALKGKGEGRE